jgi:predicted AAA+ superfamily ATPase
VERHAVSNPVALRWMLRHLMSVPAGAFSVQKFYGALRSQGIPVAKDTVHAYLGHLEDAFLVRTLGLHTASERQRMVNPRKAYPIDPGLILLYERTGRANIGHALETVVMLELERQGADLGYLRTSSGFEVDFHARLPDGRQLLIQVCASQEDEDTFKREVRALLEASAEYPDGEPWLITLDPLPRTREVPDRIQSICAVEWLLSF